MEQELCALLPNNIDLKIKYTLHQQIFSLVYKIQVKHLDIPLIYVITLQNDKPITTQHSELGDEPSYMNGGMEEDELLCDDVLPYGWYRFLAYGM